VRVLARGEVDAFRHVPPDLHDELRAATTYGAEIVAALAPDGTPVAFCYADAVTEAWWDVAVDTLEPFQRQGHASRAVAAQVARFASRGKAPLWGALESNEASLAMAAGLGFVAVDARVVWSRRPGTPGAGAVPTGRAASSKSAVRRARYVECLHSTRRLWSPQRPCSTTSQSSAIPA
jgi:GNAT superfamily N-acetyltransferase